MNASREPRPRGKGPDRPSSTRIATLLGWLLGAVGAAFVVHEIAAGRERWLASVLSAEPGWLAAGLALGLASIAWLGLGWQRALGLVGYPTSRGKALRWYFVGQMGKYVPGGVWSVVGSAELATGAGASRTKAYGGMLLALAVSFLAATLTAVPLLALETITVSPAITWLLVLVPLGFAAVHPAVLRGALRLGRRVTGVSFQVDVPDWGDSVRLVVWHLPAWLGIGLTTWCVGMSLGGRIGTVEIMAAAILAWIAGFLVVPVPAGLGVREAVFTMAAVSLPGELAATIAVVARVLFMIVDSAAVVLVLLFESRRGDPAPEHGRNRKGYRDDPPPWSMSEENDR